MTKIDWKMTKISWSNAQKLPNLTRNDQNEGQIINENDQMTKIDQIDQNWGQLIDKKWPNDQNWPKNDQNQLIKCPEMTRMAKMKAKWSIKSEV